MAPTNKKYSLVIIAAWPVITCCRIVLKMLRLYAIFILYFLIWVVSYYFLSMAFIDNGGMFKFCFSRHLTACISAIELNDAFISAGYDEQLISMKDCHIKAYTKWQWQLTCGLVYWSSDPFYSLTSGQLNKRLFELLEIMLNLLTFMNFDNWVYFLQTALGPVTPLFFLVENNENFLYGLNSVNYSNYIRVGFFSLLKVVFFSLFKQLSYHIPTSVWKDHLEWLEPFFCFNQDDLAAALDFIFYILVFLSNLNDGIIPCCILN